MLLLCMYMDGIKFQIVGEVWHTFFFFKYKGNPIYPFFVTRIGSKQYWIAVVT